MICLIDFVLEVESRKRGVGAVKNDPIATQHAGFCGSGERYLELNLSAWGNIDWHVVRVFRSGDIAADVTNAIISRPGGGACVHQFYIY